MKAKAAPNELEQALNTALKSLAISKADAEPLMLAWSAIDAALQIPGFADRLPREDWFRISTALTKVIVYAASQEG